MNRHLRRGRGWLVAAATFALITAGAAAAAVIPVNEDPAGATTIANAIAATPGVVTGAVFVTAPPLNNPNGISDSTLTQFPTHGPTFGILTSGEVTNVDDPGTFTSVDDAGVPYHGDSALDVTVLAINLNVPATANCLTFDFKFLSEEYPFYVGTQFNDAFIAELDAHTWTAVGSTISAPNNFAFDSSGDVVSINSTGLGGMSPGQGTGTAYDGGGSTTTPPPAGGTAGGATVLLSASTQVTPGTHTLYLSIFDQGDRILDSAVFLDNLRVGFVSNPTLNCKPGATPVNFRMTLTPASDENPVGTPHTVTATLTNETGAPVAGQTVQFTVSGANTAAGTGVTNANGQATFTYTGMNTGSDTIVACYNADNSSDGSCEAQASATKRWVIGPPASITLSPASDTNPVGSQHCVTATVKDAAGNPTPNITVRFSTSGSTSQSGFAVTNASGQATFCYNGPALPGSDVITAYADTDNDTIRDANEPQATATKQWVIPGSTAGCKVTYGGRIKAMNGDKATFGGNAKADGLKGQEEYQDHGPAMDINVHSINVMSVVCSTDGKSASIFGTATIDGAGTWNYRIDLKDLGEPGTADTYRIRLSNGYDSGEQVLEGGNVQIH